MSLTSAMLVGYTGINSNQTMVNTVGDDLANLNTTAFKQQRTMFETLMYDTPHPGSGPGEGSGGTLPLQIGRGSTVAAVQRDFGQGSIEATGGPADVALDGRGFFILADANGQQRYTRDGAFTLDATSTLVSGTNGMRVRGYAADAQGNIQRGALSDLLIPLGTVSQPMATSRVVLGGKLNAADSVAAAGQTIVSAPLMTANGPATETTALTDLVDDNGAALFTTGDEVRITVNKGGGTLPPASFIVGTTGSTVGDFAAYLETISGIHVDPTIDPDAGVRVATGPDPAAGSLIVTSNRGESNAIQLDDTGPALAIGEIRNVTSGIVPFRFSQATAAVGKGTSTNFTVYDSLGNPVEVRMRLALESKTPSGTTWRYYAESMDDSDLSPILGTGTISFDASGRFVSSSGEPLTIDRAATGSSTPIHLTLDFSGMTAPASSSDESAVFMAAQDGTPAGTLEGFEIDDRGVITGRFSNQRSLVLGQLAVATFVNEQGLLAQSGNTYLPGADSGDPTIGVAGEGGAGLVLAGALEQSNVELVREFIDLIAASTGISAASRVVRTSDDLLQELLLLAR